MDHSVFEGDIFGSPPAHRLSPYTCAMTMTSGAVQQDFSCGEISVFANFFRSELFNFQVQSLYWHCQIFEFDIDIQILLSLVFGL